MSPPPLKVIVVDDHPLFRYGLVSLIASQPGFEVVGEAGDGSEAVDLACRTKPDLVLMDVSMPGGGGLEALRQLRARLPQAAVVMLTVSEEEEHLFDALRMGARGYLLKNVSPEVLVDHLRAVGRGERPLAPAMAARILREFGFEEEFRGEFEGEGVKAEAAGGPADPAPPRSNPAPDLAGPFQSPRVSQLSPREVEILRWVASGLSNREIAARLYITPGTVKTHLHNILEKLDLKNRAQAAAFAATRGLAPPKRGEPPGRPPVNP